MSHRILIIQGHPDSGQPHFCHALADAYAAGARTAGHAVERVETAALDFPLLRSQAEWEHGVLPASLLRAQQAIRAADHLALFFPLWLGDMPALLKGFLEQVARPGFALLPEEGKAMARKGLTGKSARVVVTMGMPAPVYRWYFRAHSVKSLERNILGFVGMAPVRHSLIGMVDKMPAARAARWLARMEKLGGAAR